MINIDKDYLITVDLKNTKVKSDKTIFFYNTDLNICNIFIKLICTDEDKTIPDDLIVEFAVLKPETDEFKPLDATLISKEDLLYQVDLTTDYFDIVGKYSCEIRVSGTIENESKCFTSEEFDYVVKPNITAKLDKKIKNDKNLPVLEKLIKDVKEITDGINKNEIQMKRDENLVGDNKTIVGAINQLREDVNSGIGGGTVELKDYQKKNDEFLNTDEKTITGGINEVNNKIKKVQESQIELDKDDVSFNGIDDISHDELNTTNKTLIGAINEVNTQCKDIVNLSLVKHADGKVYIKKQDGTLLGNGIEIGGSDVDLSKITMSMSGQTLKLLNDGEQVATVEIPTAVVTDEQLTSIIQSKIDDGTLSALSIEDGSIGIEKNNWIRMLYYNEVDVDSATDGNWYSDATDSTNTYNNNKISNYIKVNPGDLVNLKNYSKVHFYDINKKYTNGNVFSNKSTWTVPEGIYYLRVQFTNNQVQVYIGDENHDYDTYHNLSYVEINDTRFIKNLYKNIESGIKDSNINLNNNLPNDYIDIDKLKVFQNYRWGLINPKEITCTKKGNYYKYISDFVRVIPGETLYGGSYTINCYDINKNSLNKALTYDGGKYIVPNDTYYLKVQITNDTTPEDFKFILHRHKYNMNALHSKYISYDYSFPVLRDSSLLVYMQNYLGINKLSEKKFISVGDSFSAPNKWQKVVMELLQMNGITTALSGARFSSGEVKNAYEQLKQYDAESYNADYILITMGTNDSANNVTIGSFVESNNIADFDLTTYYGGIQAVLNYACNTWKDAVVAIGFTPACGISYNEAYIEPLKKCARLYGAYYIDTLSMGYSAYVTNQADHIYGGHPTELGQQKIGRRMAKIIESL